MENKRFVIISDVTSDLDLSIRERFDLEYLPGHIVNEKGEDCLTDLDWKLYKCPEDFYKVLSKNAGKITTSPASIEETKKEFKKYLEQGLDIIHLSLSSGLSGSYKFAQKAADELKEEYQDRQIFVIDTLRYSTSIGLLAVYASQLREQGLSVKEVADILEEKKHCVHEMGPMDDLMFLAKKGRISKAKAFMGTLVGVKPMGDFNRVGLTTVMAKAKGLKSAINAAAEYVRRNIVEPENQIVFISNTNRVEEAKKLEAAIKEKINCKEIISVNCHPASATNIGPGLYAAYFFGKPISENNVEEEKLLNEILKSQK